MKRYAMKDAGTAYSPWQEFSEDVDGDLVTFDDAQAELAARDKRIETLEAENTRLRAALEAAAEAFKLISGRMRVKALSEVDNSARFASAMLPIKTFAVDACRACWAALGK